MEVTLAAACVVVGSGRVDKVWGLVILANSRPGLRVLGLDLGMPVFACS
jgi:hypothetical protein